MVFTIILLAAVDVYLTSNMNIKNDETEVEGWLNYKSNMLGNQNFFYTSNIIIYLRNSRIIIYLFLYTFTPWRSLAERSTTALRRS